MSVSKLMPTFMKSCSESKPQGDDVTISDTLTDETSTASCRNDATARRRLFSRSPRLLPMLRCTCITLSGYPEAIAGQKVTVCDLQRTVDLDFDEAFDKVADLDVVVTHD